jgi:hypothetical protein
VQERPYVVAGEGSSDLEQVEAPEVGGAVGFGVAFYDLVQGHRLPFLTLIQVQF